MKNLPRVGIMFDPFPSLASALDYWDNVPTIVTDWLIVAEDPNTARYFDDDAEAMDTTNWDALMDALPGETPELVRHYSDGWLLDDIEDSTSSAVIGVASRTFLIVRPGSAAEDAMLEQRRRLESYPLLDEDAYSALDFEAWCEWAQQAYDDEVRTVVRHDAIDEELADWLLVNKDRLLPELESHLHYFYGFSGEYGPNFLDIFEFNGGRSAFEQRWAEEDQRAAGQQGLDV